MKIPTRRYRHFFAMTAIALLINSSPIHAREGKARPAPSVRTVEVASHPISRDLVLIGNLRAEQSIVIASEVPGKITEILVKAGQKVQAGDILMRLNNAKSRAALMEAKAVYQEENRKHGEYRKLHKKGALTKTELDAQASASAVAKARLDAAQAALDDHQLIAPFNGTVGLIDISVGQHVTVGQALLNFDDLSMMQLDVNVPEQYLSELAKKIEIQAYSKAYPNQMFTGALAAVDTRVNDASLNVRARIDIDNTKGLLRPGMMMEASLQFAPSVSQVIPVQAVEYSGTKRFVYVVDAEGVAHKTQVELGARIDNSVTVEKGLNIGDRIVSQGLVAMRDGVKVKDLSETSSEGK